MAGGHQLSAKNHILEECARELVPSYMKNTQSQLFDSVFDLMWFGHLSGGSISVCVESVDRPETSKAML